MFLAMGKPIVEVEGGMVRVLSAQYVQNERPPPTSLQPASPFVKLGVPSHGFPFIAILMVPWVWLFAWFTSRLSSLFLSLSLSLSPSPLLSLLPSLSPSLSTLSLSQLPLSVSLSLSLSLSLSFSLSLSLSRSLSVSLSAPSCVHTPLPL
jgi:hypothetical protein